MKNLRVIFALSIVVFCTAIAASSQSSQTPSVVLGAEDEGERYRIGFQDVLQIDVFRHADLTQRVGVGPGGTITLFRLEKPIVAVCKTERELSREIEAAYKARFIRDPQVTVGVAEQRSQAVAVIGAVEKPGNYYINRRMHLLGMLALAGGPNKEAGTRMLVARTGSTTSCEQSGSSDNEQVAVLNFKISDVQQGKESFWLKPGDVVSVSDADVVYVYGDVMEQGALRVREPITLTQAIASSRGLKAAAAKDKVRILRQKPGSTERDDLIFDLNQIDKGKIKDPMLEPNDIVAVSRDKTKAVMQGFVEMLKNSAPNALIYR